MKPMPNLNQFTGTDHYWQWTPVSPLVLTDGVKYLTDELNAHWLLNYIEFVFIRNKKIKGDHVVGIQLDVSSNGHVTITLENDFGKYGKKVFKSVEFPPEGIFLFAYPYGQYWIIMLTSEY